MPVTSSNAAGRFDFARQREIVADEQLLLCHRWLGAQWAGYPLYDQSH
jgi:hypothetical protein